MSHTDSAAMEPVVINKGSASQYLSRLRLRRPRKLTVFDAGFYILISTVNQPG
jgi:hypothetical protein